MRKSMIYKAIAAVALSAPLSAFAVVAVYTGPVCLSGVVQPGEGIAKELAAVANNPKLGVKALPAEVAKLIRGGANPAVAVQTAVAYGADPQATINAAMGTKVPKDWTVLRVAAIACGADPTRITDPAGFGGVSFPTAATMPQSQGGDHTPVSPS